MVISDVHAFILCGGLGTRLRAVLADRPKSMALIGGVPFLQLLIEKLKAQSIQRVILGTGYMAEQVEEYFGDGSSFGVSIRYSRESEPLGTGGALRLAAPLLSDPVLVLNGDSYLDWAIEPMLDLLISKEATVVMALQKMTDVSRYGSVTLDDKSRVTRFVEKGSQSGAGLINAGVYLVRRDLVHQLSPGKAISLEKDVFPSILDRGIYGLVCSGLFIDIGIPDDLQKAQTLLTNRPAF